MIHKRTKDFLDGPYYPDYEYQFENCSIVNNIATQGGGIYVETSKYSLPTFGPGTVISQNYALNFGGGIYIQEFPTTQTFVTNATLEK